MVRALDWGSRSREFESHHSDDMKNRMVDGRTLIPLNHAVFGYCSEDGVSIAKTGDCLSDVGYGVTQRRAFHVIELLVSAYHHFPEIFFRFRFAVCKAIAAAEIIFFRYEIPSSVRSFAGL